MHRSDNGRLVILEIEGSGPPNRTPRARVRTGVERANPCQQSGPDLVALGLRRPLSGELDDRDLEQAPRLEQLADELLAVVERVEVDVGQMLDDEAAVSAALDHTE